MGVAAFVNAGIAGIVDGEKVAAVVKFEHIPVGQGDVDDPVHQSDFHLPHRIHLDHQCSAADADSADQRVDADVVRIRRADLARGGREYALNHRQRAGPQTSLRIKNEFVEQQPAVPRQIDRRVVHQYDADCAVGIGLQQRPLEYGIPRQQVYDDSPRQRRGSRALDIDDFADRRAKPLACRRGPQHGQRGNQIAGYRGAAVIGQRGQRL